jgi:hypothetical protein
MASAVDGGGSGRSGVEVIARPQHTQATTRSEAGTSRVAPHAQ